MTHLPMRLLTLLFAVVLCCGAQAAGEESFQSALQRALKGFLGGRGLRTAAKDGGKK